MLFYNVVYAAFVHKSKLCKATTPERNICMFENDIATVTIYVLPVALRSDIV